jgi:hypothetical protein
MRRLRTDYNIKRAKAIINLKKKGYSYNNIGLVLFEGRLSPQRIQQIVKHYNDRVIPELEKEKKDFLLTRVSGGDNI